MTAPLPAQPMGAARFKRWWMIRAGLVEVGGDYLRLPGEMVWPPATNSVLFVRKYYAPLIDSVLGKCKSVAAGQGSAAAG